MVKIKILSENGIHARPASKIVNIASKYDGDVNFIKDGSTFNAKSIMNVMGMGLQKGDEVELEVKGTDAERVEKDILDVIEEINH